MIGNQLNLSAILAVLLLCGGAACGQEPAPAGMALATAAAKRFPQPVLVGDLIGRTVLQPVESRPVLGRVKQIVRSDSGLVQVVVAYGGLLGVGARSIAVPVEAMALLGKDMEILDFTPEQLSGFPNYTGAGISPVAAGETIRVSLARPSH